MPSLKGDGCMGKIRITRKVTVKQQIRIQRQVQYTQPQIIHSQSTMSSSTSSAQQAINKSNNELKTTQRKLETASRHRTIPSGVYGKPVEDIFYALDAHRKPEDVESKAMYDVFISHASEDKAEFVNPLVETLQSAGVSVWYDTLEMQWGKSLREQIDSGIKRSKFAMVVLSKHFFAKKWPQRELDGILAKETVSGNAPLPIWYNLTQEEVYEFSPTLSGVFSISNQDHSIADICKAFQLILEKEDI